ncbi:DUF2789 family protein [Alteromonas sp. 345S023]|uniref:DUF2789 family protein n=1 Tax=Alteromonas profundi TaxID=2696062 RepID=A0A7X5RKQ3_9ALTE|nr:DUF2789 family protein [Alteromonas profundi]NDV90645.1 DUF2789 family protein [Alteromonas profundi]
MFAEQPTMKMLFAQLGLDDSEEGIQAFIDKHKGLNESEHIEEAPFWSERQSAFLKDALINDADWAVVIDELNVALH